MTDQDGKTSLPNNESYSNGSSTFFNNERVIQGLPKYLSPTQARRGRLLTVDVAEDSNETGIRYDSDRSGVDGDKRLPHYSEIEEWSNFVCIPD